ncbi:MAG: DNA polymerase III subunit gamma/tau [bacterium]|nr:DNA polymerase III subunit gamma/tau [bacterium]
MSEIALYRKYRPKSFKDVVGQEQVTTVLEASIKKGNISHAYIFAGSRGTGKTSVARIFAAAIGCTPTDLYEIDAASNRGIDEVRAIREAVHTSPMESPYKVYVLDEAHMITPPAWNALLKTLEEPPKYVVFIFATTEIDKIPETVVSRCQTFIFKKPTHQILKSVVEEIAKGEGYSIDKASAELVAFLGDGSFRDAQGILQKVMSASQDKKITIDEVELITGSPKGKLLNSVIEAIEKEDLNEGLKVLHIATGENIDMKLFLRLLIERVRIVMLLRFAKDLEKEISENLTDTDFEFLKELSVKKGSKINSKTLDELLRAYEEINFAAVKELPLELALIRLIAEK